MIVGLVTWYSCVIAHTLLFNKRVIGIEPTTSNLEG